LFWIKNELQYIVFFGLSNGVLVLKKRGFLIKKSKKFKINYFLKSVKNTLKFRSKNAIFAVKIEICSKFLILMQKRKIDFF